MDLTPEHRLLCDAAAMRAHLDKYSRIEQRALLTRVIEHLDAVVEAQASAISSPDRGIDATQSCTCTRMIQEAHKPGCPLSRPDRGGEA